MSSFGFPSNPYVGQTHQVGSTIYVWDGTAWLVQTTGVINASTLTVVQLIVTGTQNINTSLPYINGDLQVYGGAWVDQDLYVGGTLFASGGQVLTTSSFAGTVQDGVDIDIVETESSGTTILTWNNISTLQSVTSRGATTNRIVHFTTTTESTATTNGAVIISGGLGVAKRINCESIRVADAVLDSTLTLVNTTATTAIDTFTTSTYRSAKYLIQIDEGIGTNADFELREILLVADNNNRVWATEYGVVTSNGTLGEFAAESTGGNVTLYFTANAASNKTVKVLRTGIAV